MKKTLCLLFLLFLVSEVFTQELETVNYNPPVALKQKASDVLKFIRHDPPIPVAGDWGQDYLAFNGEPTGRVSSVFRLSNNTLYLAVPDTSSVTNAVLSIYSSTNNGQSWNLIITGSAAGNAIDKTEMHRSGLDSVYCIFRFARGSLANQVYIANIADLVPRLFLTGGYRDFSAFASSTGSLYLFLDTLGTNSIIRYASFDGFYSVSQRGVVTSTAAHIQVAKSSTGDTCIIMYYQAPTSDTVSSAITAARYRENAPGSLASIAFLTSIIPAGQPKDQFGAALGNNAAWLMYTEGNPGSRNIFFRWSTNGGISYDATAVPLANSSTTDEYWFDLKSYNTFGGGCDAVYYFDSTGGPNSNTDNIRYLSAIASAPQTFSSPTIISQVIAVSNNRGVSPFIVEYYDASGDAGVFWLGLGSTGRALFYDRLGAPAPTNPLTVCRNSVNKTIPDHSTVRDTIYVGLGSNRVVTDLIVRIDTVLHTWDSDLSFYIRKGSVSTKFINRVGGSGDNFIGTNIKDSAALCQIGSTGCNTPPFTGTFRPSVGGSFAGFLNQPTDGHWILSITDTVSGDTGLLRAWCLVIRWQDVTSGETGITEIPSYYELMQNYPNPFNPATTIKFAMPKAENVKLTIFDILGREVAVLVNEFRTAGVYEVNFDASLHASGVYFYRLETPQFTDTKKMLLVK
ncbi:MAG: T9SS type A sorting domain-containing protein [Ignavibacteria bacterium]|nr:T9SS type A sorting domain-containing protein [Ignavibacteria bacterium]